MEYIILVHGNELNGDSGTITSPMYPKAFEKTVQRDDFFWRINVVLGSKIRVTFKEVFMASLDECDESNSIYVSQISMKGSILIKNYFVKKRCK